VLKISRRRQLCINYVTNSLTVFWKLLDDVIWSCNKFRKHLQQNTIVHNTLGTRNSYTNDIIPGYIILTWWPTVCYTMSTITENFLSIYTATECVYIIECSSWYTIKYWLGCPIKVGNINIICNSTAYFISERCNVSDGIRSWDLANILIIERTFRGEKQW
jgi:hypothetical protein